MFSRPTSCRPCLMSSIALSYRILSGWALLSTPVDLLTFFFLWKICVTCASLGVALNKNSAPRTQSARPLQVTFNFEVAQLTVWPKRHLSRDSRIPRRNFRLPARTEPSSDLNNPGASDGGNDQVYPEPKARWSKNFAPPDRSHPPHTPSVMHGFIPRGCLALAPHFNYFQRNVTISHRTRAGILSRFRGAAATRPFT